MMKNRATCGFLVVIALLVMALGVTGVVLFSTGPLREKMSLIVNQDATSAPTTVAPKVIVVTATPAPLENNPAVDVMPEATSTPTAAPAAEAVKEQGACGNRGTLTLLFIGADFSGGVWPPGADAVRVIKVDYDQQKVTMVAFPRDLWLNTPGLASQDIRKARLGMAYHYMKTGTIGSEKHRITTATTLVGQTLYDTFGVTPQAYFTLQMNNLPEMVDALDGVDIYIPEAFTSDYKVQFPAGQQHLNGAQAREYVRTYNPGGDDARRQRQNRFVDALQATLMNAGLVTKIPELYKSFDKAITTDLSPKQIAELACMVEAVPEDQKAFYEVAGNLVTPVNIGERIPVLEPKVEQIKAKLVEWLGEE